MNPQGGEGNNSKPPVTNATASEPNVAVSNPLDKLEGVVAAAQQQVAQSEKPQTEQFMSQFGSGVAPPVTEVPELSPTDSKETPIAQLDPSIKTVDDLLAKGAQTVEAGSPAEQTPAEKLKKQIADSVDAFLEEVTKGKVAV